MSGISAIGGNTYDMTAMQGMRPMRKPDPAAMAENLFSKLDTSGQGYIEQADLQSAFASISDSETDVGSLFTRLDADSDGKVTKDEFSSSLTKLAEQLDEQFQSMRMQRGMEGMGGMGGMGGMPPPPPPGDDAGFTQEELSAQLEEIGDTDSARASLISSVVENFDTADADGDGKVSFQEAMAYRESTGADSAGSAGTAAGSTAASETDSKVMLQIMRLMHAYDLKENSASSVSVTA